MNEKEKIKSTLIALKNARFHLEEADRFLRDTYSECSPLTIISYTMNTHTITELDEEIARIEKKIKKHESS